MIRERQEESMRLSVFCCLFLSVVGCASGRRAGPSPSIPSATSDLPAARAPVSDPSEAPQNGDEEHVLRFLVAFDREDSRDSRNRELDRRFLNLARRSLDQQDVRGVACRWLLSYARVLRSRLEIGAATGAYGYLGYLEPDDERYLSELAARPVESCRRDPAAVREED